MPPEAENVNTDKMKNTRKVLIQFIMLISVTALLLGGCKKEDSTPARKTTYDLKVKDVLGVSGTATFTETNSTSTTIDLVLANVPTGTHPAYLYMYSEVEGGAVAVILNPVDATGKSSTVVSTMTYSQLIAYDGYIKVVKSNTEQGVTLAQGDIGGNVLTSTNKTYALSSLGIYGVSGSALFEKRVNGNTLVTVTLVGAISGEFYPATINLGSVTSVGGGPVVKLLNNVDGTTGQSFTNIRKLDSGVDITYENWMVYDGYVNVYQFPYSTGNIICNGNIGSN